MSIPLEGMVRRWHTPDDTPCPHSPHGELQKGLGNVLSWVQEWISAVLVLEVMKENGHGWAGLASCVDQSLVGGLSGLWGCPSHPLLLLAQAVAKALSC